MRVALIVLLASLLILIGWISMRMARNPDPQRRRAARRGEYIPHDGGANHGHHGNGGGDGGGSH